MLNDEFLIRVGGLLHFGILIASFLVPRVLRWKEELQKLEELNRQLIWVHGVFIVIVIFSFGLISSLYANSLASGIPLARAFCFFVAFFWLSRLLLQFFVFKAKPHLTNWFFKLGYHGLTLVFFSLVLIYGKVACFH